MWPSTGGCSPRASFQIDTSSNVNGNHVRVASCGKPLEGVDVRMIWMPRRGPSGARAR